MQIDITEFDDRWLQLGDLQKLSTRAVNAIIKAGALAFSDDTEVSLVFADDARVASLNETYRSRQGTTNVLSFPSGESAPDTEMPQVLGDVVFAFETVLRESSEQGKTFESHLCHLIVHGFLHLLGYDHLDEDGAREMEGLEISALAIIDIPNPYELNI